MNLSPHSLRVGIVGATGYSGVELIRILKSHPYVQITAVVADSNAGYSAEQVYPSLQSFLPLTLQTFDAKQLKQLCDMVFVALPGGLSTQLVPQLIDEGLFVIDLGGDYRLPADVYEKWYKKTPPDSNLQQQAVYGLSEWNQDKIRQAEFITNPGCYPTAALLGALPLVESGIIDLKTLIIDAKSGVSGSGRGLALMSHFSETNENFRAYKVGSHQHTPEIEQELTRAASEEVTITFTTQLVPMTRGIMATVYAQLRNPLSTEELRQLFDKRYEGHPFVRVRPVGAYPATKEVAGSNFCDIGVYSDPRTGRATIISAIDNLVKGAAGQAVQNLNIKMGWDETAGLWSMPMVP